MNLLHFEYQGKSARVMLSPLPPARPKPHVVQKTSAGEIRRLRVLNGLTPGLDPARLTAKVMVEGNPELDLAQAGRKLGVSTAEAQRLEERALNRLARQDRVAALREAA